MTGTLRLSLEEARELYLAIGTRNYVLTAQGKPTGRLSSLQGRVDNVWAELEHLEKTRGASTP